MNRIIFILTLSAFLFSQQGEITNVTASQRTDGSKLVDVTFDLSGENDEGYNMYLLISFDIGENYTQLFSISGDLGYSDSLGVGISVGNNKHIVWNAGEESPGLYSEQVMFKVVGTVYQEAD